MTKYREILCLKSLGFSERNIAQNCSVSRNTVARGLKKAAEINLSWPLCKLRSNGMPVPLLRNGYSIFNGTKYR